MRGPLLPDEGEAEPLLLDITDLDGVAVGPIEAGAERIRLLEFLWETEAGLQPVLYVVRELLD